MKQIILNADDFGMSEAFNHGVIKSYTDGLVRSASIMINMPAAAHAIALAKEHPALYLGQHTNLVLGKPCAAPETIPSLVDDAGFFHRSSEYRSGKRTFVYDDVKRETLAQMEEFKRLIGHYPSHIEGHAVGGPEVNRAFYDIAVEFGIHTTLTDSSGELKPLSGYKQVFSQISPDYMHMLMRGISVEDFETDAIGIGNSPADRVIELHFHPGYLDQFILDNSSLTVGRCKDLETLCSKALKTWLDQNNYEVITFDNLKV